MENIIEQINKEELIKAGVHFGHPTSKWNPKFKDFILTKKNGIHIINIDETVKYLDNALKNLLKIVKSDGNILFVGTKAQAKDVVVETADSCGMFYIAERWIGGTLTNFSTIKKSIKRLVLLEKDSSPIYNNLTKKERNQLHREKFKLADLHRGIKDMRHLPAAIVVVDAKYEKICIAEAKCLGIPTFGIVDTNTNPYIVDYPIPGNDDSIKSIRLILSFIANQISDLLGSKIVESENIQASSENNSDKVLERVENKSKAAKESVQKES